MKNLFHSFFLLFFILNIKIQAQQLRTGAEVFLDNDLQLIKNKRVGVITNHTALVGDRIHLVDTLHKLAKITALFGPEHGIRGDAPAGDHITDTKDPVTHIPVYSLYGKHRKPTKEMLREVDILIFDIQDVGARFYTYISTLYNCIESAAENNIPIIILDRPNPLGGELVEGPILKREFYSFVGITELPVVHGMTIGELGRYFNFKIEQSSGRAAKLTVIPVEGWSRSVLYSDYNLSFIKPSPNLANLNSILVYPGTCLLEATNISEGRGTETPFMVFGAPFINSAELIRQMKSFKIDGIEMEPVQFTPRNIPGMAVNPKLKGQKCNGLKLTVTNFKTFLPVRFGIILISVLNRMYPADFYISEDRFNRLCGDNKIYEMIKANSDINSIIAASEAGVREFKDLRKQFLLY